ncbi:TcaA 3rd/4th domain-containing protein [Peribacillus simplex]|uniref:TcaA 3rd/4th domain-containing protein n=1 Tax=Peribacillus simplex TaxID=1478 RepID=UPI003CFFB7D0
METAKVSKKRKMPLILILLGLFLIGIVATFYMYFNRPSGEEIVNQFETAVNQGDIDTLEKLVKGNKEMKLTKKNLEQLISYAKDEPSYLKESVFIMKAQAAIEEKDKDAKLQNPIFKMATEGEILQAGDYYISKEDGLFSSYQIYARPYSLTVSSDQVGTLIKVNDDELLETKEGNLETTVQNLPPGIYTVTGSKKYEYAEINAKEEINLFEDDTYSESVALELTGEQLAIESDVEDISIFINGKDIGKKATVKEDSIFGSNDEDPELFGPFSTDGSIKVHGEAKLPWGIAKSEPQTIKEDMVSIDVTPKPFADNTNKDQVVQTINDFAKQRIQALVKKDAKIIKTASDNIVKEYAEDIQFAKSNESYWKGEALGTRIDFGNVTLSNENEQYQVKLPVEFNSKEKEYHGFNEGEPLEEESEVTWLILTYNNESKKWIVSEIESNYFDNDVLKGNQVVKTEFK